MLRTYFHSELIEQLNSAKLDYALNLKSNDTPYTRSSVGISRSQEGRRDSNTWLYYYYPGIKWFFSFLMLLFSEYCNDSGSRLGLKTIKI